MKIFYTFLLTFIGLNLYSQQEFSGLGILYNTFWIQTDLGRLSSFVIEPNNRELLITALHGFNKLLPSPSKVHIQVNIAKKWKTFDATLYHLPDTSIDIAILVLAQRIQYKKPYITYSNIEIGQECRFYGFPYGRLFFTDGDNRYIPFIKRGLVSSISQNVIFLDGMNNPGFSGGPVVIQDVFSKEYKILGVISGYLPKEIP